MANNPSTPNYHPLVRGVARALRSSCGVNQGDGIIVGCSGGADSVALLRALAFLAGRRQWGLRLIVGHVQHHLRGEAAEADAEFVEQLADDLGLMYHRRDIQPGDLPGNLEANARGMRYRALATLAFEHGARFVATAHHADDQLETLLMRLIRGSGVQGMRGIAWRRRLHVTTPNAKIDAIRPMLRCDKKQVLDLLQQIGQAWREDQTNTDTTRTRARIRHEVIPTLKALAPNAAHHATEMSEQFADCYALLQAQVTQASQQREKPSALPREQARSMNPMVFKQLLRRDLMTAGVRHDRLSAKTLSQIAQAARDDVGGVREFMFDAGVKAVVNADTLMIQ